MVLTRQNPLSYIEGVEEDELALGLDSGVQPALDMLGCLRRLQVHRFSPFW